MIFRETQKYNQIWLWAILLGLVITSLFLFKTATPNSTGIITMAIVIPIILLLATLKLKTVISNQGITMSFGIFTKKYIEWLEVEEIKVIDYGFVGGWGIRLSPKYGIIFNVKGRKGILIKDHDGRKIVIGTQKEHEAKQIIRKLFYEV